MDAILCFRSLVVHGRESDAHYGWLDATIRIPDISKVVVKDDYIVKGACSIEMQTVKDLKETDYVKVTSANYNRFGNNPHIKVVGV